MRDLRYSIEGFVAALKLRTSATILVEGRRDGELIKCCLHERETVRESRLWVVDDVRIIDSPAGDAIGNREKVERVADKARHLDVELLSVFDREFDRFCIGDAIVESADNGPSERLNAVSTKGHSIENYLFFADQIAEQVGHWFGSCLTREESQRVVAMTDEVFRACAGVSIAFGRHRQLTRCRGLFDSSCWMWDPRDGIVLNVDIVRAKCVALGIDDVQCDCLLGTLRECVGIVDRTPISIVHEFCHGAITFKALLAALPVIAGGVKQDAFNVTLREEEAWRVGCRCVARAFAANPPVGIDRVFRFVAI